VLFDTDSSKDLTLDLDAVHLTPHHPLLMLRRFDDYPAQVGA
jgi:hypothetical protein